MCRKIQVIVNDLKKTQGNQITFHNVLVGSGDSAAEIKKAKLKGHGIVARDRKGKVIQLLNGHAYDRKTVEAVVQKLLSSSK